MEIDIENVKKLVLGLDIRIAKRNLHFIYPQLKPVIEYAESDRAKFTVTAFKFNKITDKFTFVVASDNMITMLPMLHQENEFLRRFLMIFQTFFNQIDYTMANLDVYFRPSEAPNRFLAMLVDWLGVNLKLLSNDEKLIRRVLQYAISLYKIRGTVRGLRLFLYVVTGILPEIIESNSSSKDSNIDSDIDIDRTMFTGTELRNVFYVYFPCLESDFSENVIETIHNIVQSERPSFMQGFIIFKKPVKQKRKVTTYEDAQVIDDSIGVDEIGVDSSDTQSAATEAATETTQAEKSSSKSKKSKKSVAKASDSTDSAQAASESEKKSADTKSKEQPAKKDVDFDDSIMDF